MAKFVLIGMPQKRVVSEFEAQDLPAARAIAQEYALATMTKVVLAAALRVVGPVVPPRTPPTIDDQPV